MQLLFGLKMEKVNAVFLENTVTVTVPAAAVRNLQKAHVGRTFVGTLMGIVVLPVAQMPLCHHATIQHVTAVQRRLLKSSQSVNRQGPDVLQQLTVGTCGASSQRGIILRVGQHLPLQLLHLRFHLTASTQP